jgi:hypothetical protein
VPQINLHLVHSEAGAFVSGGSGRFDAVVMNELLDDLPSRTYYATRTGIAYEFSALAEEEDGGWRVEVEALPAADVELPTSSTDGDVGRVSGRRPWRGGRCSAAAECCSYTTTVSSSATRPSRGTRRCRGRCRSG